MNIKVYKFGGASVSSPTLVNNLIDIVSDCENPLVVVISAIGKTTNALEEIVKKYYKKENIEAKSLLQNLEISHKDYVNILFENFETEKISTQLNEIFSTIDWILDDEPVRDFDYYYDQIVSCGELLSTSIVAEYMIQKGYNAHWIDIRDYIRTDDTYRDARVDLIYSKLKTVEGFVPLLEKNKIIITQGYIGSTDQNENTTLGREGSDYTASLLGSFLGAKDVSIWKDVKGLLNADPRLDSQAIIIPEIPYSEVIEMAYYGAQVIHPKTIKPLHNAHIPMYVKCFLDKKLPGTKIGTDAIIELPPITVVKENQLTIRFTTLDFSFFDEGNLTLVYDAFNKINAKQNMTHISAISLRVVIDHKEGIEEKIITLLDKYFKIEFLGISQLKTIRHYTQQHIDELINIENFQIISRTKYTLRYLI